MHNNFAAPGRSRRCTSSPRLWLVCEKNPLRLGCSVRADWGSGGLAVLGEELVSERLMYIQPIRVAEDEKSADEIESGHRGVARVQLPLERGLLGRPAQQETRSRREGCVCVSGRGGSKRVFLRGCEDSALAYSPCRSCIADGLERNSSRSSPSGRPTQ